MITGKQYAEKAMTVLDIRPAAGYIMGTKGETWTSVKQKNLETKYYSNPQQYSDYELGAKYGKKWIGHRVWDCSGLTSWTGDQLGLKFRHGSNSSYRYDCQAKGAFSKGMRLPIGAWVYTGNTSNRGHIGIVVSDTKVLEAQGTIHGVILSKLSLPKWTWWGCGKNMSFDFIPGGVVPPEPTPTPTPDKHPTIKMGSKGEYVKELQKLLNQNGNNLEVDGIFGAKTESAVRKYQIQKGLAVDGIVGPKTWAALLKS